jgi:nucleoside-diphosphate-sugar epimerase
MRIVITGGAGFIGNKLVRALLQRGTLTDRSGTIRPIDQLVLFDVVAVEGLTHDPRLEVRTGDITDRRQLEELIGPGTDGVFHLAAVVSANAEEDFDLGMAVNLDGTRHLLEACRALAKPPRFVFASSCAVYGGEMPALLSDQTILTPQTSYGAQKAAGELLVSDYTRKGFIDGRALRLPTILVRPGRPNRAASTFASSILREPLAGQDAVCPVGRDVEMYVLSPRRVIEALQHAYELPEATLGPVRALTLPGITVSVGEMLAALERVAGEAVAARVHFEGDPTIQHIVAGWPTHFQAERALALGFQPDNDIDEIIRAHIEDELAGHVH